jgi:multiple sugar transport system permease protein
MFPPIIITIPLFPLFTNMGLIDTPITLIFVYATFMVSMSVLLLKSFIDNVPKELEEAAWLDGCGRVHGFIRIMAPNIIPGIIASIIFVTLFAWNDFMFALIFTGTKAKTAPVVVAELLGSIGIWNVDWGMVFAAATMQLFPMLVFVWIIQKPLLRGFTTGMMK